MKYTFHTNSRKILGDLHTPVSIYLKIRDIYAESSLLESSDFHGNENSLSYIAICPLAKVSVNNNRCTSVYPDGKVEEKSLPGICNVSGFIREFLGNISVTGEHKKHCSLFGYTAYDAVRYFAPVPVKDIHHAENDAPDMLYILYKYLIIFDHFNNELVLIELLRPNEESRLNEIENILGNRNYASYNFRTTGGETSPVTDEEYKEMVRKGIEHCQKEDVSQIVLSRRFEQRFKGDDFKVYRALRSINPSPYLFYFDFGGFRIFGSSPETHCRISGNRVTIDPIAGTAFRTGNPATDKQRTEALLSDPKENAEHVMLVELAKNDLSRNAHDVKVEFYKEVQYYSHVIHLVSRVSGTLDEDSNVIQTLIDTFPAGTLSGAPKVRALQLIAGIEKHNRGAYGGCIGIIGLDGDINQAITIRSFVSRDNTLYYQAGAGVLAQSNDERELQEVNSKLDALKVAIDTAEHLIN